MSIVRGEFLAVEGTGEVIVEEPLQKTRMMLTRSKEIVHVSFNENEHHVPSCLPCEPDVVEWEIVPFAHIDERHFHEEHERFVRPKHAEELYLRIMWRCSCPRTIQWQVTYE